jgi:uncharacterized protein YaiL (DUF2058 family)
MRNALHEQLLKAGLVDEKRLEEAEREKRRERMPPPSPPRPSKKPPQQRAQQRPAPAPVPRPTLPAGPSKAELEAKRNAVQTARRELERAIVQVIKANRRPHNDGEQVYNFIDGQKVGRIYVTADMHAQLSRGELAIVRLRTRYAVVPTETASGIAQKAPEYVVVANQDAKLEAVDPAYAEHPIPDDLRW